MDANSTELNQLLPIPQLGHTWIKKKSENDSKCCSQREVPTLLRRMSWDRVLHPAPTTRSCNPFFKQICSRHQDSLPSRAQSEGRVLILHFLGRMAMPILGVPHHRASPLSSHPSVLPAPNKSVVPHFFPPPPKERNKGRQSLMAGDRGIWGLVYYMLNEALNYWWLLPSLTAFLVRETWANKHVSQKSPYSDRSWQEKKHPGFTTVY